MQWDDAARHPQQMEMTELDANLSPEQQQILALLRSADDGIMINELMDNTGKNYSELAEILLEMELNGYIRSLPGGNYRALK